MLCGECHNDLRSKKTQETEKEEERPDIFKDLLSVFKEMLEEYEVSAGAGAAEAMSVKITLAQEAADQFSRNNDPRYLEMTIKLIDEIKRSLRIA